MHLKLQLNDKDISKLSTNYTIHTKLGIKYITLNSSSEIKLLESLLDKSLILDVKTKTLTVLD